jgi:hypothetical protein
LATNASRASKLVWVESKAPAVVGKFLEEMAPVT